MTNKRFYFFSGLLIWLMLFAFAGGAANAQNLFFAENGEINFRSDVETLYPIFLWHCDGASGTADYDNLSYPASYSTFYTSNINLPPVGVNEIQSPGKFGECYYSGDDQGDTSTANYVDYTIDDTLIGTQSVEISFWLKLLNPSASNDASIFSVFYAGGSELFSFGAVRGSSYYRFYEYNSERMSGFSAVSFNDDNWHHWVISQRCDTTNFTRTGKLFIDGNCIASATFSNYSINTPIVKYRIGTNFTTGGVRFQIDDIQVSLTDELFDGFVVKEYPQQGFFNSKTNMGINFAGNEGF